MINVSHSKYWTGSLEAKAIHEAGHAVVGVMLGQQIRRCTIKTVEDQGPHVEWEEAKPARIINHQVSSSQRSILERLAQVAIAGHAAEMRKFGVKHTSGVGCDMDDIRDYAEQMFPQEGDRQKWRSEFIGKGTVAVHKYMHAIEELACALLDAGDQSHSDVVAILKKHGFK